jgi:hypothetical protein
MFNLKYVILHKVVKNVRLGWRNYPIIKWCIKGKSIKNKSVSRLYNKPKNRIIKTNICILCYFITIVNNSEYKIKQNFELDAKQSPKYLQKNIR